MRVAVLGGGLQGCCIAMALAEKGVQVTLYDRNPQLLTRTAIANEGKIHLGYMYAGDPTLNTAHTMLTGALAFMPFMARHLDLGADHFEVSRPAVYLVHRASQKSAEQVAGYMHRVHALIEEKSASASRPYFGFDLRRPLRAWPKRELACAFNDEEVMAAFDTPEVAIDPIHLAALLRARIGDSPNIALRLGEEVRSVEEGPRLLVAGEGPDGRSSEEFDHVVNALWEGRLAVDATLGLRPGRPWIYRLKYGVTFRPPANLARPLSATIVLGPFGEVVNYPNGAIYLTWYPECVLARSDEVAPPHWSTYPAEPLQSRISNNTLEALSEIVLSLRQYQPSELTDVKVRGGAIVAWGETDIDDPQSELHRRYEIGVTTNGAYHSVDPGKLTMAPYFAEVCAERIMSSGLS